MVVRCRDCGKFMRYIGRTPRLIDNPETFIDTWKCKCGNETKGADIPGLVFANSTALRKLSDV